MNTYKNITNSNNNTDLFFLVYRNSYLKYLILSNLYKSELLIDNQECRVIPRIPESLNNITISKGLGYCNWLVNNLFNKVDESKLNCSSLKGLKQCLRKEGIDEFSFLSRFYINSFEINNLTAATPYKDYGIRQDEENTDYQPPKPKIAKLNLSWSSDTNNDDYVGEDYRKYVNLKSDHLEVPRLTMFKNQLPCNLKSLKIQIVKDPLKQSDLICDSITKLDLGREYTHPITSDMVGNNIQNLNMGFLFNCPIDKNTVPNNLVKLNVGDTWNNPFGNNFNDGGESNLPNNGNLLTLKLGSSFTYFSTLYTLESSSITSLEFSNHFNQPLTNTKFPNTLTTIKFGSLFNQPISNDTFKGLVNLKTLIFGQSFCQELTIDNIPNNVETLTISNKCKLIISDELFNKYYSIPSQISKSNHLNLISRNCTTGTNNKQSLILIPMKCNSIKFEDDSYLKIKNIPRHIKYLEFGTDFKNTENQNGKLLIRARDIPKFTTHLSIQSNFVQLDFVPSTITHLKTNSTYPHPLNILEDQSNNLLSFKSRLLNLKYINHNENKPLVS